LNLTNFKISIDPSVLGVQPPPVVMHYAVTQRQCAPSCSAAVIYQRKALTLGPERLNQLLLRVVLNAALRLAAARYQLQVLMRPADTALQANYSAEQVDDLMRGLCASAASMDSHREDDI
jgi:hypothetical protein